MTIGTKSQELLAAPPHVFENIGGNHRYKNPRVSTRAPLTTTFFAVALDTDISALLDSYSGCTKAVLSFFLEKDPSLLWLRYKNPTIALAVGYSERSVQRATAALCADGLLAKSQVTTYAPNDFELHPGLRTNKSRYLARRARIPSDLLELEDNHGIRVSSTGAVKYHYKLLIEQDVVQSINVSIVNNNFSKRPHPPLTPQGRRRVGRTSLTAYQAGLGLGLIKTGGFVINSQTKKFVIANRHDDEVRKLLQTPDVHAKIITPTIKAIAQKLQLAENEMYKLVAYDPQAHEQALATVNQVLLGNYNKPIKDRVGWILGLCRTYCNENGLEIDTLWCNTVAYCMGLSLNTTGALARPLTVPKKTATNDYSRAQADEASRKADEAAARATILSKDMQCQVAMARRWMELKSCDVTEARRSCLMPLSDEAWEYVMAES